MDSASVERTVAMDEEAPFKPKRGRPNRAQVAAIEAVIIEVARDLFLKNGYALTAMETVAASAGISKGTLYARYPDKSALFRAIVAERIEQWGRAAPPLLDRHMPLPDLLFQSGVMFLEQISHPEQAAFGRLVTAEAENFPELAKEFHDQGLHPFVNELGRRISDACSEASGTVVDPAGVADLFVSTLLGWHARNQAAGCAESAGSAVARLVSIFLAGRAAW